MKPVSLTAAEREFLHHSGLFQPLDSETRSALLDRATVIDLHANDTLFEEGQTIDSVYCVLSGLVRLYRKGKAGREADVRIFQPGETLGCCTLFPDNVAIAHAAAVQGTRLVRIDAAEVKGLSDRTPALKDAFSNILSRYLSDALNRLADDRLLTSTQRVANYLLRQCPDMQTPALFRLPFQKNVLAGKLGLAPEALSRAFSALREVGVTLKGREIRVADPEALRRF